MQDPFNARMGESGVGKGHAGGNLGRYSMVETWGQMGGGSGRFRGASDMEPAIHLREPGGEQIKKNARSAKLQKLKSDISVWSWREGWVNKSSGVRNHTSCLSPARFAKQRSGSITARLLVSLF